MVSRPSLIRPFKSAGLDSLKVHIQELCALVDLSAYHVGKSDRVEQRRDVPAGRNWDLIAAASCVDVFLHMEADLIAGNG